MRSNTCLEFDWVLNPGGIKTRKLLSAVAALMLTPAVIAHAADRDPHDWNNLRELRSGQQVEIVRMDKTRVRGRFAAVDDSSITIRAESGDRSVLRGDTFRVISREKARRLRSAAIGAAILGGAALVAGAAARSHGDPETSGIVAPLTIVGAGIGAAIGMGFANYPTVYVAGRVLRSRP
jgi:hypothetical protein